MLVNLLLRSRGKAVVLKLVSAEEVGGVVVKVNKRNSRTQNVTGN